MMPHSFIVRRKAAKCAPTEPERTDNVVHLDLPVNLDKTVSQVL